MDSTLKMERGLPGDGTDSLADLLCDRLARVEGQIRGISRMARDGRTAAEILRQASAARGALDSIARLTFQRALDEATASDPPRV